MARFSSLHTMMLLPHTARRRRRRRPRSWWQTESSWGCEWGFFLDGSFCFLKEMVYTRLTSSNLQCPY
jgi:hypothetical protein